MIENLLIHDRFRYLLEKCPKVVTSKIPVEGLRCAHEEFLEFADTFGHRPEVRKVVRRKRFPLQDREVNFNLVEPTGMDGKSDRDGMGELFTEPLGERRGAVGTALIHDPEYPACGDVRFPPHDLRDEAIKRGFPRGGLDTSHDVSPVYIPGGQIRPRPSPLVLVFHPLPPTIRANLGRMKSPSGLNARFLIRRDDVFIRSKASSLPDSFIQVQDDPRPFEKEGIPRPDPRPTPPRFEGVGVENPPDRSPADGFDVLFGDDDPLNVRDVQAAQRFLMLSREFAGDAFDHRDDLRGKKPAAARGAGRPEGQSRPGPSVAAISGRIVHEPPGAGPPPGWRWPGESPRVRPTGLAGLGRKERFGDEGSPAPRDAPAAKRQAEIPVWVRAWFSSHKRLDIQSVYRQNHAKPYTHL